MLNLTVKQAQHRNGVPNNNKIIIKFVIGLFERTHCVPAPNHTQLYSSISPHYHLAALDGCGWPELTCCCGCFPWLPTKVSGTGAELPNLNQERLQCHRALLFTFHSVLSVRFSRSAPPPSSFQQAFIYQPRPPSHHLAVLIPQRSTLSYPAGRPKHRSNLVLAENGLISAGGDQERGRRE